MLPIRKRRRKVAVPANPPILASTVPNEANGTIIPLTMVNPNAWDVAYTVPVQIGTSKQNYSLQVDTGSSDTWIASTKCDTPACSAADGHRLSPENGRATGQDIKINYLSGEFSGPVYWELLELGGYQVASQALAIATDVQNEALGPLYSGILGVGPPANSVIASKIPPKDGDTPDGATVLSNVYGTSPAPASRFISLVFERPGDPTLPSLMGLGAHPPSVVPNSSVIHYAPVISDNSGPLFWKAFGDSIRVYANGNVIEVDINRQVIFDSGVPVILAHPTIATELYGALNVSANQDGSYTIPCATPLNITISIDGFPTPIPLHPLDTTTPPSNDPNALSCQGTIRSTDLSSLPGDVGMVLGVAFLRNVYTVLASDQSAYMNISIDDVGDNAVPQIGLLPLTDPTKAMEDFKRVRLQQLPFSTPNNTSTPTDTQNNSTESAPVGVYVGAAVGGFLALCVILFGVRWCILRRRPKTDIGLTPLHKGPYEATATEEPSNPRADSYHSNSTGTLIGSMNETGATPRPFKKGHKGYDPNDPWDPRNYSMSFRDSDYDDVPVENRSISQTSPTTSPAHERESMFFSSDPLVPVLNPDDPRGSILSMMGVGSGHGRRGSDPTLFYNRISRPPPTASIPLTRRTMS